MRHRVESIIICAAEMERLFIIPGGRRLTGDFLRKRITKWHLMRMASMK